MLEKIKNDPLMKEYEAYIEKERKKIKAEINQLRVNTNIQINVLNIRLKKLSKDRNRVASVLYKKHYKPKGQPDWYKNNECYKLFGKRKKDLTPEELKQYNNIMADKRRQRLIKS